MTIIKSILLVEDDLDLRSNIRDLLEGDGYEVFDAEHGQAALDILSKLSPDKLPGCILLDFMMPIMDGTKFIETLASEHAHDWAKIPIILITAKGGIGNELPTMKIICEYLRKPMDIGQLLEIAAKYCGR